MEIELYKSRSYSGCIKSAYILFSTNLTTIFKRTWLSILVYSIPLAIMIDLSLSSRALNEADLPIPTTTLVLMSGMCIWSLAGCIWFIAVVNRILNTRTLKANFIRGRIRENNFPTCQYTCSKYFSICESLIRSGNTHFNSQRDTT